VKPFLWMAAIGFVALMALVHFLRMVMPS